MAHILQPKAPNLTLPTIEYSEDQQNQMQNQLRLYFNQLDNANKEEIQKATFVIENPLPLVKMIISEDIGVFHVVAGSFSIEQNSFTRLNQLKNEGYNARKIGQNKFGLFQVAYSSFSSRSEADIALAEIRLSDNKAAWILNKKIN